MLSIKVDGTSFSDAGSLVTTVHLARDLSARFKLQKKQNKYGGTKIITYQVFFFSCLSEIGLKQKLPFGRQLLSNSVCVRKTLL